MEVYTKWESREVLVAYGIIMNDMASENLANYEAVNSNDKPSKPPAYKVKFITHEMIEREMALKEKEQLFHSGKNH